LTIGFLFALAGCEPTPGTIYQGDAAIALSGDGCVRTSGEAADTGDQLTLEVWVRAEDPLDDDAALITYGDAAMLWVSADGVGLSNPIAQGTTGWQTGLSIHDGLPHHVAATWSPEGGSLFVDGVRAGSGSAWGVLPSVGAVTIGCGPDGQFFDGVLDEVRVSSVIRYAQDFGVEPVAFVLDEDTTALWHLDEGSDDLALEARDRFPGAIENGTWTEGLVEPAPG
jgi:hypothetical protein